MTVCVWSLTLPRRFVVLSSNCHLPLTKLSNVKFVSLFWNSSSSRGRGSKGRSGRDSSSSSSSSLKPSSASSSITHTHELGSSVSTAQWFSLGLSNSGAFLQSCFQVVAVVFRLKSREYILPLPSPLWSSFFLYTETVSSLLTGKVLSPVSRLSVCPFFMSSVCRCCCCCFFFVLFRRLLLWSAITTTATTAITLLFISPLIYLVTMPIKKLSEYLIKIPTRERQETTQSASK